MAEKPVTTIAEMLGSYSEKGAARFHMPGHKGRGLAGFMPDGLAGWDVTEISQTDNLHAPEHALLACQERMAAIYQAEHSFYAINGGSGAIQAMVLSLDPCEHLLLCRDCHKSALSAAALAGVRTSFFMPRYDPEQDCIQPVTAEDLNLALETTGATAVLLTSPNYYGFCVDLPAISETVHRHGALLLIDGAHGAHYPFSPALPLPLAGYADIWCHSQHKTMNALTQAASLHLGHCRISPERVKRMLALTESTSPSFLLMASLDWAMHTGLRQDWTGLVETARRLQGRIQSIPGLSVLTGENRDETRLVIDVSGRGLTGYEAQLHLEKHNIYIEMADRWRLVLILSPEDDENWYRVLLNALTTLPYQKRTRRPIPLTIPHLERRLPLREAMLARSKLMPIEASAGCILAEAIGVYPPGIAFAIPGEVISPAVIAQLQNDADWGAVLFGVHEGCVSIVEEA